MGHNEGLKILSTTANHRLGKVPDRLGWDHWVGSFVPVSDVRRLAKRIEFPIMAAGHGSAREGAGAGYVVIMRRPSA